jgi:predicted MFS family arabinose efflux permease
LIFKTGRLLLHCPIVKQGDSNQVTWKYRSVAILITLLLMNVVANMDRNLLTAFAPQILGELSISDTQFGILAGAVWVLSFSTASVLAGALADRYSRTRILAVSILGWSAFTAASGLAASFGQMTVARLLVACGEAGLVPPALSLLLDLFSARHFSTASGIFFVGFPLGIGAAFVVAGTGGAVIGWRGSFYALGLVGALLSIPMFFFRDERKASIPKHSGLTLGEQFRRAWTDLRATPVVLYAMLGFVAIHFLFASLGFLQLWLVNEKGFEAGEIARRVGTLQILFGILGAISGGAISDRLARRLPGGHATFVVLLIVVVGPLMLMRFFSPSGSPAFYVGLCAVFFLPMAVYGPANALLQGLPPARSRSLLTGVTILMINIVALAAGSAFIGIVSDRLKATGAPHPLSTALFCMDVAAICAAIFFLLAALSNRNAPVALTTAAEA